MVDSLIVERFAVAVLASFPLVLSKNFNQWRPKNDLKQTIKSYVPVINDVSHALSCALL